MAESYGENEALEEEAPSVESDAETARLYLRKFCPEAGDNL